MKTGTTTKTGLSTINDMQQQRDCASCTFIDITIMCILDDRHDYYRDRYLSSFVPHSAMVLRHSVIIMKI